jgi:hypothetical protein
MELALKGKLCETLKFKTASIEYPTVLDIILIFFNACMSSRLNIFVARKTPKGKLHNRNGI